MVYHTPSKPSPRGFVGRSGLKWQRGRGESRVYPFGQRTDGAVTGREPKCRGGRVSAIEHTCSAILGPTLNFGTSFSLRKFKFAGFVSLDIHAMGATTLLLFYQ